MHLSEKYDILWIEKNMKIIMMIMIVFAEYFLSNTSANT